MLQNYYYFFEGTYSKKWIKQRKKWTFLSKFMNIVSNFVTYFNFDKGSIFELSSKLNISCRGLPWQWAKTFFFSLVSKIMISWHPRFYQFQILSVPTRVNQNNDKIYLFPVTIAIVSIQNMIHRDCKISYYRKHLPSQFSVDEK